MPPTESRNRNIQYGCQAAILKMTLLKINRLLPIYISILPLNFEVHIQSQSKVSVWKPKVQYGRQAAILKVTSLKINRLLSMATINMYMKFKNWNSKANLNAPETMSSTDRGTVGRTYRRTRWIQYPPPPPPTSLDGGIKRSAYSMGYTLSARDYIMDGL